MPNIRPATPADIPALLDGIARLAAHHTDAASATTATLMRDLFGPTPWMHALISDNYTGYAILLPLAQIQYGRRGMDLHHLFVWPDHRGNGLGRALLAACATHARSNGCTYLTVGTHPTNTSAEIYYLANGFTRRDPSPRFAMEL
jgi:GNAT superfamily N-acetyltransferase